MKLPRASGNSAGFTLFELVIIIGIVAALAAIAIAVAVEQYRTYALEADRTTVVNLLERARSGAMNNIGESEHGFYTDGDFYVLFRGSSYGTRDEDYDYEIAVSPIVTLDGLDEVVFERFTGETNNDGDIELSNGERTRTISVNEEGRITW